MKTTITIAEYLTLKNRPDVVYQDEVIKNIEVEYIIRTESGRYLGRLPNTELVVKQQGIEISS